jgi:prepilin-type N-terminal cleavage/methylation domain-containing protein
MLPRAHPRDRRARQRGFSLIELLVVLFIIAEIVLAVGILLDVSERTTRIQTQLADLQQSVRVAQGDIERIVRMAGRGGFPHGLDYNPPLGSLEVNGFALHVRNNVGTGGAPPPREVAIGFGGSPRALVGTDILTVRGCFESPLFQVRTGDFTSDLNGDGDRSDGRVFVRNPGPSTLCQDLTMLTQAVGRPLLVVSPLYQAIVDRTDPLNRTFVVGRITAVAPAAGLTNACDTAAPEQISVSVDFNPASDPYLRPFNANQYPTNLTNASWVCLLEEHRYFVREEFAIPGLATSELRPRLTRAAMDPGRERPLGATGAEQAANLRLDLADDILDLQVALGFDSDNQGAYEDDPDFAGDNDQIVEGTDAATRVTDDWLFNDPGDVVASNAWRLHAARPNAALLLEYVRVSILGRAARPDSSFRARNLVRIEDADFTQAPFNAANSENARLFRRRLLQTVIEPRNL